MSRSQLDEAHLVLIAAAASATAPEEVLASTDVAALARVCAAIEACNDALDIAAAALVEIAKERPFGANSNAAAWLACALAAPTEAARLAARRSDAIELVGGASRGEATRVTVREHLASRRTTCPACRRPIAPDATTRGGRRPLPPTPMELVARCAVQHRSHGRFGQPIREPMRGEDTPWRPVVANQKTGAMIVLADEAPLLLVPVGDSYLVANANFVAGDLVGDWHTITAQALVRTSVPAEAVAVNDDGSMIDCSRLDRVLNRAHANA